MKPYLKTNPLPDLFIDLEKSVDVGPCLYLDIEKGNPHRDPTVGHFISGGAGKAMNGHGQEDLEEQVNNLMEGEDLDKEYNKSLGPDLFLKAD